jgi:plastocyanin
MGPSSGRSYCCSSSNPSFLKEFAFGGSRIGSARRLLPYLPSIVQKGTKVLPAAAGRPCPSEPSETDGFCMTNTIAGSRPDVELHELEEGRQGRRDFMFIFGVLLAGLCLLASMVAWGMAARSESEAKSARTAGPGQLAAGATKTTPMVHLSEFQIDPSVISASVGDKLEVMNVGSMTHNLAVEGTSLSTSMISPRGAAELTLTGLSPGTYTVYCQVPGHRDSGMHAQLRVTAASSVAQAAAGTNGTDMGAAGAPGGTMSSAQMDAAMATSTKAFPAKTNGLGGQPLAPKVLADGTEQFDLTAQVVKWEVSPGS